MLALDSSQLVAWSWGGEEKGEVGGISRLQSLKSDRKRNLLFIYSCKGSTAKRSMEK
jgi:hypothetical protein